MAYSYEDIEKVRNMMNGQSSMDKYIQNRDIGGYNNAASQYKSIAQKSPDNYNIVQTAIANKKADNDRADNYGGWTDRNLAKDTGNQWLSNAQANPITYGNQVSSQYEEQQAAPVASVNSLSDTEISQLKTLIQQKSPVSTYRANTAQRPASILPPANTNIGQTMFNRANNASETATTNNGLTQSELDVLKRLLAGLK